MNYTDLIFDLYGTLVDIHTEESQEVWEKTALFFGYYGACYTADELKEGFQTALAQREAQAGQSYECYPDIPVEQIMASLFQAKGVADLAPSLGFQAAQLFRISSTEYIRLYPQVLQALARLRQKSFRIWLLSNAQRTFTAYELRHLGLESWFDGIYLSSDFEVRKPDVRFFQVLLQSQHLQPEHCLMIGNDRETDIAGAMAAGMDTLYLHTNLTPAHQAAANPALAPGIAPPYCHAYEWEGTHWDALSRLLAGER